MNIRELLAAQRLPRWFWPLLLGLNFVLHAPAFRLPPTGIHTWRQCNTMAVARNFYEEGMNILRPRVDRRNDSDGVTGMQFPSFEWVAAGGYHLFGFHESIPRLLNWLIYMAGVVAFYYLVRGISGRAGLAAVGAWCLAWSPELFFHGVNALPDVLALTASLAGLYWFGRWRETRRVGVLALSLLAITLAGLTKLQFLIVGFPIAVFVLRDLLARQLPARDLARLLAYAVVAVAVPLAWYAYALRLIEATGLADFGLVVRPADDLATAWATFERNLRVDLPETLVGYGTLGLLAVGLWRLLRHAPTRHPWFLPGLAWGLALAAYYFAELHQMKYHGYYLIPLLPVLLLLATWGAAWLARFRRGRGLLLVLLLAQPVWATVRISSRWVLQKPDIGPELFEPASRARLEAATPAGARCLVGPDESGCEQFYFLHKKGFGINHPGHLFETTPTGRLYVADCIARGARYLYSNDSTMLRDPRLQPYLKQQLLQEGAFGVWELRAPAPGQLQSARHAERSRSIFTALSGPIDVVYCHDSRCFYQLNSTAECQVQLLHLIDLL